MRQIGIDRCNSTNSAIDVEFVERWLRIDTVLACVSAIEHPDGDFPEYLFWCV